VCEKGDQKTEVEDKKDVFVAGMTGMRGRRESKKGDPKKNVKAKKRGWCLLLRA